ncbi:DUF3077 domain-containing protein, partial [Pseudomonas paralactis]|nr:DUF3077 domain-containing protein [Pseudomonas paralactis]
MSKIVPDPPFPIFVAHEDLTTAHLIDMARTLADRALDCLQP